MKQFGTREDESISVFALRGNRLVAVGCGPFANTGRGPRAIKLSGLDHSLMWHVDSACIEDIVVGPDNAIFVTGRFTNGAPQGIAMDATGAAVVAGVTCGAIAGEGSHKGGFDPLLLKLTP